MSACGICQGTLRGLLGPLGLLLALLERYWGALGAQVILGVSWTPLGLVLEPLGNFGTKLVKSQSSLEGPESENIGFSLVLQRLGSPATPAPWPAGERAEALEGQGGGLPRISPRHFLIYILICDK